MLTRSIVAAFCGALVVAARPGQDEHGYDQAYLDPQAHFDAYRQAGFSRRPAWPSAPDAGNSWNPFEPGQDEPPKHPPFPHFPHHGPKDPVENKTIYQALEEDSRFSRVFKLVNFTEEVTSILNDSNAGVTFFAVPDKALHPPKRHHKKRRAVGLAFDSPELDPFYNTVAAELSTSADELEMFAALEGFVDYSRLDADDDDKERKRKIIKKIVTAVLKYHILPGVLSAQTLATNNTYSSGLKLGDASLDSEALRVRISSEPHLIHPAVKVNFYAAILHPDVKTDNGVVHVLSHPLFPPPSIFTVLFGFSDMFATLTSAIQRTNVTDEVDWHWVKDSHTLEGAPAVTFFAPTNKAFRSLPPKLKFFLFSPFGSRALKKILAYHVVPDYVFHTNWAHNASDSLVVRSSYVDTDAYTYLNAGSQDASEFFTDDDFLGVGAVRFDPLSPPMDDMRDAPHFPPPPFEFPRHGPAHCAPPPHFPPPACACHGPEPHGPPPPPPHFPPFDPRHDPHAPPPPHFPPPPHGFPRSECPPPFDPRDAPPFPPPASSGFTPSGVRWSTHEVPHFPPPPPHFPGSEGPPPFDPRHEPHFPPPPPPSGPRDEPPHFPSGCPPPFDHRPPPHYPRPHFPPPPHTCGCATPPPPPFPFPFPGHDTCARAHHQPQPAPDHARPHVPQPKPVYTLDAALPALLANHTLHVHVAQFRSLVPHGGFVTRLFVNGHAVAGVDVPTRNGAVHVVDRLIRPFRTPPPGAPHDYFQGSTFGLEGGEEEDEWADWEEWLPQWANED